MINDISKQNMEMQTKINRSNTYFVKFLFLLTGVRVIETYDQLSFVMTSVKVIQ